MKDNRLCTKCGLLPQAGTKPEPPCKPKCACKPKKCRKDCCSDPFVFRKVVIPAALGDDITGKDKPANGAYTNAYVEYEANGSQYMYDSYGIYTKLEVKEQSGVTDFNELTGRPKYNGEVMTGDTDIPEVNPQTIFYVNSQETGATRHIYKDEAFTEEASVQDLLDANEKGPMAIRITIYPNTDGVFSDAYIQNTYVGENDYQFVFLDEKTYREYAASTTADTTFYYFGSVLQTQLSAGNNIQIANNVVSATYTHFTGTDGQADGIAGLVPAPVTTDAGKFLKADGTWSTLSLGTPETLVIANSSWAVLSSSDPYTYSATVTATTPLSAGSTVELINDQAVLFATYGFAVGSVDTVNNTITIYSIGAPSASVSLTVDIR